METVFTTEFATFATGLAILTGIIAWFRSRNPILLSEVNLVKVINNSSWNSLQDNQTEDKEILPEGIVSNPEGGNMEDINPQLKAVRRAHRLGEFCDFTKETRLKEVG